MDEQNPNFVCQRCGACCRVPGYVRLTPEDVDALAAVLGLTVEVFIDTFTDLSPTRSGLVLKGDPQAPCRFLTEDNLCRVHRARPQQCRDYPERWRSDEIETVCAAKRMQQAEPMSRDDADFDKE
ncbi:MAG: YkgJ family cysteine cluster protein [Kiritimatiellae bacterium]|nr:YkgJ family cysteine cluster protein [Kiritimatiellia bacterium]